MEQQQPQPQPQPQPQAHPVSAWLPGVILIAIGSAIAAVTWFGIGGEITVLVIGLVFLVAYTATRNYGFLVPGGILAGLGLGILAQPLVPTGYDGAPVLLGLGAGFVGIYVVDELVTHRVTRWWPLVPGLGLLAIGALIAAGAYGALDMVGAYAVPVLLILLGVWFLVRPRRTVR